MNRMLTDAAGNTYLTGSRNFGSATSTFSDVFVAKLDPAGSTLFLATFSGKGSDSGSAIGLDAGGNISSRWIHDVAEFPAAQSAVERPCRLLDRVPPETESRWQPVDLLHVLRRNRGRARRGWRGKRVRHPVRRPRVISRPRRACRTVIITGFAPSAG